MATNSFGALLMMAAVIVCFDHVTASSLPRILFEPKNNSVPVSSVFVQDLQNQPAGPAENNIAYLNKAFDHRTTLHFEKSYIYKATNIPNYGEVKKTGLYMFLIRCQPKDKLFYPIYFGYTSESFRGRMVHSGNPHTVPKMIANKEFQTPKGCQAIEDNLFWRLIPVDEGKYPVAKFIESSFLKTFDFALNKEENGQRRQLNNPQNQAHEDVSKRHLYTIMAADVNYFNSWVRYQGIP